MSKKRDQFNRDSQRPPGNGGEPPEPEQIWPPPEDYAKSHVPSDAQSPDDAARSGGATSDAESDLSWAVETPGGAPRPETYEPAAFRDPDASMPDPEPEPMYEIPMSSSTDTARRMVAGKVGGPRSGVAVALRSQLACHVDAESEVEIGQLWGHVFFGVEHLPPRAIIVTAARSGDGATQIATSLALVGAASNRELRIVLVDFNLRAPRIAELLGIRAQPGLTDVLDGHSTLDAAMQAVTLPNGNELHVLTGGTPAAQPLGLLKSRQMQAMLTRILDRYDHAILDVAPANAYPDPQVIGALVDGAILVARASATPRETVAESKKRLDVAGVRCLGLVLNQRSDLIPDVVYRKI